jgi:DNA polymerase-3 subunit gamma/tau
LDKEYKSLLTEKSQKNLESSLSSLLGELRVTFDFEELTELTLTQENTRNAKNKKDKIIKDFLADENLQKLEKLFDTKVAINTIKPINKIGEKNV